MKKRLAVIFTVFTIILLNVFLCGFSPKWTTFDFVVNVGSESLSFNYKIPFGKTFERVIKHKGSYAKFCENKFSGNYSAFLSYLNENIISDIEALYEREYVLPTEPEVVFDKDGFSFTEGKNGSKIDKDDLFENIVKSADDNREITVEKIEISPVLTVDELKENTVLLANFSTEYSTSSSGRKHNIALAAERINRSVIPARGVFSFNLTVGARTEENGFEEAKIISDGEFVSGVGGGVCQVSTTLFNAWLLSGRKTVYSSSHTLAVSYVKPSLDAMVSGGTDLVLYNDSKYPAYLKTLCDGKSISVSVYGSPSKYKIKLRSETLKKIPAEYTENVRDLDWQEGEQSRVVKTAHDGILSEAYRDYYLNGKLVKSEFLRRNYYRPVNGEVAIRADEESIMKNSF